MPHRGALAGREVRSGAAGVQPAGVERWLRGQTPARPAKTGRMQVCQRRPPIDRPPGRRPHGLRGEPWLRLRMAAACSGHGWHRRRKASAEARQAKTGRMQVCQRRPPINRPPGRRPHGSGRRPAKRKRAGCPCFACHQSQQSPAATGEAALSAAASLESLNSGPAGKYWMSSCR